MSTSINYLSAVQDIFSGIAQDICVLFVFVITAALWRHSAHRARSKKPQKRISSPQLISREPGSSFPQLTRREPGSSSPQLPRREPSSPTSNEEEDASDSPRVLDEFALKAARDAEAQILQHLKQHQFTRALSMFRACDRKAQARHFGEELFSAFLEAAIRVGKLDIAQRLLQSLKQYGIVLSCEFWRTILKLLSSRKHFETCIFAYNTFGQQIPADKVVFSCLINAALEMGSPKLAQSMLDRLSECGDIQPKDHILFFRTFAAVNDVDAADDAFRKLGDNASPLMLNLLLGTCVNAKRPQRAMHLIQQAHELELKYVDEHGILSEDQRIVDVVSYNTVLKGFAQNRDFPSSFECLKQMQKHGLQADDVTCVTMLDLCVLEDNSAAIDKILDICGRSEMPFDTVTCSVFIKGLLRANQLPKAMELYQKMKNERGHGARPDIVTYSLLIKAFVEKHDLDSALLLVEDMGSIGLHPDDIILTHLLEGCRQAGNQRLGKQLFNEMIARGVKPSKFTLMAMLKLHGHCGAYSEAYRLLAGAETEYGLTPTVLHYTCLMSASLRTKSYDQAFAAFQLMVKNGVSPDKTTIEKLLPGMVRGHRYDCVVTLAEHALQASPRIPIDVDLLKRALTQMEQADGQEPHMLKLYALMQKSGIARTSGR